MHILRAAGAVSVTVAALIVIPSPSTRAQEQFQTGQDIAPAYEGFWANDDGSFDLLFGYFNRNWKEEFDIPVGPANNLEPGGPDQGQPTHFFPRRNQFVFKVRVPPDFGNKEVVWTLTSNGRTNRAYASLRPEYKVDRTVMQANLGAGGGAGALPDTIDNVAPELTIESEQTVQVRVGDPVTLVAVATDDGLPKRRPLPVGGLGQGTALPQSATGLRLTWFRYRGPSPVVFDPPQTKIWEDPRDGADSPWAPGWQLPEIPPDNRWTVRATFGESGTYVLRARASDGGLFDDGDVTVTVTE